MGLAIPGFAGETGGVNAEKQLELESLQSKISVLRKRLSATETERDALQTQLQVTEKEVGKLSKAIRLLSNQLKEAQAKLITLRKKRVKKRRELGKEQQLLAEQVRASYLAGRQGYFKLLLNQQDPAAVGRNLTYYNYLNQARAIRIKVIDTHIMELDSLETDIARQAEKLESLRQVQTNKKEDLEINRLGRRQVLVKLSAKIKSEGARLETLLTDEKRLRLLLSGIEEAVMELPLSFEEYPNFSALTGQLDLPVSGKITKRFGARRKMGKLKWQGVLINAEEGQTVAAISQGRVAFADWLRGYGLMVIIDHGDGYMSLYGHNQSLYAGVGAWVEPGEIIATVGDSGGRERAGLYFEIRHKGAPKNPLKWCKIQTAGR